MRAEWDKMMAEYEGDNNHDHFQRDEEFTTEVAERFSQVSPEMRQEFLDFLFPRSPPSFQAVFCTTKFLEMLKTPTSNN